MPRLLLCGACLAALVAHGCGDGSAKKDRAATSAVHASAPTKLAFASPPIVVLTRSGVLTTAVRTTKPLFNGGLGLSAVLRTSDADPNRGGTFERIPGYRRCYAYDAPVKPGSRLEPDQSMTVELLTEDGDRVSARVPLRSATSASAAARRLSAARSLGCPRGPQEQRCSGSVPGPAQAISVDRALGGASCATARSVLRQVGTWTSTRCSADLCVKRHRMNRGFRCTVAKVGEADWTIRCRRGKQSVAGSTAD